MERAVRGKLAEKSKTPYAFEGKGSVKNKIAVMAQRLTAWTYRQTGQSEPRAINKGGSMDETINLLLEMARTIGEMDGYLRAIRGGKQ